MHLLEDIVHELNNPPPGETILTTINQAWQGFRIDVRDLGPIEETEEESGMENIWLAMLTALRFLRANWDAIWAQMEYE